MQRPQVGVAVWVVMLLPVCLCACGYPVMKLVVMQHMCLCCLGDLVEGVLAVEGGFEHWGLLQRLQRVLELLDNAEAAGGVSCVWCCCCLYVWACWCGVLHWLQRVPELLGNVEAAGRLLWFGAAGVACAVVLLWLSCIDILEPCLLTKHLLSLLQVPRACRLCSPGCA